MKKNIILCLFFFSCPLIAQTTGKLFDTRDSKSYPAVKIGDQWWMAKNLNYGILINSSVNASKNKTIEKYCYDNNEINCIKYGALYQWDELMNYSTVESTKGICPGGWHIPSDKEWKKLEMTLGMSSAQAELLYEWRGTTEGIQLKTDGSSGFNGSLAGYKNSASVFENLGSYGYFSSSSNYSSSDSYIRILGSVQSNVARWTYQKTDGISLRCVKDSEEGLFSVVNLNLQYSGSGSSSSWGDYDKDGDLDILYGKARYRNSGGTFTHIGGYTDEKISSSFCDYNNDTYIDFLAAELDIFPCGISTLFTNNGITFDSSYFELQCCSTVRMAWGDYDNNGSQDVIIEKWNDPPLMSNFPITLLFRNDNKSGSFTDCNENIPDMYGGSVDWGDFDNDLDIDLLITGIDDNGNKETFVFRNDNGELRKMDINLGKISDGEAVWADYDSDGDLDIVMSGTNITGLAKIYRNDGNAVFTDIMADFGNISGKVSVADMDNDGRNDIIFFGVGTDAVNKVVIYKNNGNDSFSQFLNVSTGFSISNIFPGDYDNDGDLDLLLGEFLLRNNFSLINQSPSIPTGLKTRIRGNEVIFSWDNSNDDLTSSTGLSYNLRVGTTSGGSNILCPHSISSGKLSLPGTGNTFQNCSWKLKDLEPGTYYWSVQAIDNSFASSSFSVTSSFEILEEYAETIQISDVFNSYPGYSIDVGDYDNDGDYDLLCSYLYENPNSADTTFIFKNVNQNFQKVRAGLPQLKNSSVYWVDLNNDNTLELILSGKTFQNTLITDVYIKQSGDSFIPLNSGLKGLYSGSVDCADFDNDGDQDILLTGMDLAGEYYTLIYENEGMSFTEHATPLIDVAGGSAKWADVNLDCYYDIILSGLNSSGIQTAVYFNDKNKFFYKSDAVFEPICGEIDVSDIDNDQFPDFVISGTDSVGNKYTVVYDNNNGVFNKTENNLTGFDKGTVEFGDYDVNGRSDILLSKLYNVSSTYLYLDSDTGNVFLESMYFNYGQSAGFIDFDSDNDLDLFISGYNNNMYGWIVLVRNNYYAFNTPPSIPSNLSASQEKFGMALSWDRCTDFESTGGGLTYNIRIGSTPGGYDIVSPMSASDGKLRRPGMGNTQTSNSWLIEDLPVGTYYWSVQAIDQSFCGGSWAPEQTIDISKISADFMSDTVCEGNSTTFTDLSEITDGSITAWKWYFGDGDSASVRNPVHQYQQGGYYWVTLTAYSGESQHSKTKRIRVRYSPHADYNASTVCEGNKTLFTDGSDIDSITVASWLWSFGDGDNSHDQGNVLHPYLLPGNYQAKLKITASNGCADSVIKQVMIGRIPNAKIGLDYGFPELCMGDSTRLSVEYNKDYHYQWKTGGINLTKDTLDYLVIKDKGSFSVDITNRIGNCLSSSEAVNIIMLDSPPILTITASSDTNICQGQKVYLEIPYVPLYSYLWKYNGLTLSDATSNFYDAEKEGSYTVDVSFGTCKTTSQPKQIVYKPGLSKPKLLTFGSTGWYFVCDIENALTYRWYYNSNLVAETGNNTYWAGDRMGEYYVEVNDGGECFVPSERVSIPVITTNISETGNAQSLSLLANPASGIIRILYADQYFGKILIRINNMAGQILHEIELYKSHIDFSEEISLNGLKAGLYILEFKTEQYTLKERFVILR
jgi:uncharacterized protein (TIGR02145 family)